MKKEKKQIKKLIIKILSISGLYLAISAGLVAFALFWQQKTTLLATVNAFYFSALILFSFGFFIFAANHNAFSAFVYGTKSFFKIFTGKRHSMSYYEYTEKIKENPLPKHLIIYPLIATIPNLVVAIILHIIFNAHHYVTP